MSVIDCAKMYKIEKYLRESLIIKLNDCFCNICYIYLFEMEFMSNISETVFLNNNSCCVFYFIPISSTFFRNKAEKTTFFQFFPVSSRCPGRNRFLPEETQPCTSQLQHIQDFVYSIQGGTTCSPCMIPKTITCPDMQSICLTCPLGLGFTHNYIMGLIHSYMHPMFLA